MPDVDIDAVVSVIDRFVARRLGTEAGRITPATPLLADGWIDSFGLFELIAELRESLVPSLDESDLIPDDFASPQALTERLRTLPG